MIRPLEYCLTLAHVRSSIDTIDQRIVELLEMRDIYSDKALRLEEEDANGQKSMTARPKETELIEQHELVKSHEQK